jgi:hypothetical protein
MNFFALVLIALTGTVPAFGQGRDDRNGGPGTSRGNASAVALDYEAIRLERIATVIRIHEKITLDGRLDEPAWSQAIPAADFLQWSPRHGEPAQEPTEVRFLYDDDNLYVGFTNYDSDIAHALVKELKEDFSPQDSDQVGVLIDSLHDRRSAFSFGVNVAGAKRDQQISNDSQFNQDWDGVWDAKVSRNSDGWIAEFMIPFKTLRFSDSPTQVWGLNMNRRVLRRNEESMWSLVPQRYRISRVSQYGTLTGLENIHQGRNLKVTPYATAGVTQIRDTPTSPLRTMKSLTRLFCTEAHSNCGYDGGIDAKYSLTSSLTLDATYRTDFAQVEVDQQQVNLTRFNLFFPEKRDFFLENAGTFSFGASGNFGLGGGGGNSQNLVPFFSRRIGLSAEGTPIPIIGGTRVSGQIDRYDVGFLAMKTERLGATPSNNYIVGRVKRSVLRNSYVGTLMTSRDSAISGDYNRVYGTDAHFQFYQKLEFDSYILRSDTAAKSGRNQAAKFQTAWRDEELSVSWEYNSVQANFDPQVGFVRRKANTQYSGDFAYRPLLRNSNLIRNLNFSINADYYEGSETRKLETRTQEATAGIQFENNGSINFTINQTFDRLAEPFVIRRGTPDISIAGGDYKYLTYGLSASSGQGSKVSVNGNFNTGEFWDGHRTAMGGAFSWNPNAHFGANFTYSRNSVELPQGRSFITELVGTRLIYGFNPRAFLNAFIQYNADTHQISSNIRLDFTHHPLSHLYIVYNDRRDTISGQLMERALILKLTNLFNF